MVKYFVLQDLLPGPCLFSWGKLCHQTIFHIISLRVVAPRRWGTTSFPEPADRFFFSEWPLRNVQGEAQRRCCDNCSVCGKYSLLYQNSILHNAHRWQYWCLFTQSNLNQCSVLDKQDISHQTWPLSYRFLTWQTTREGTAGWVAGGGRVTHSMKQPIAG